MQFPDKLFLAGHPRTANPTTYSDFIREWQTLRIHDDAGNKVIQRQANWSEEQKRVGYNANPCIIFLIAYSFQLVIYLAGG
jgi:hypothetical protein